MGVNFSIIRKNKGSIEVELLKALKQIKLRDIKVILFFQDTLYKIYEEFTGNEFLNEFNYKDLFDTIFNQT